MPTKNMYLFPSVKVIRKILFCRTVEALEGRRSPDAIAVHDAAKCTVGALEGRRTPDAIAVHDATKCTQQIL